MKTPLKIIDINGFKVVECVHCEGTGICRSNTTIRGESHKIWRECPKCGRGLPGEKCDKHVLTYPICAICGGKGYNH